MIDPKAEFERLLAELRPRLHRYCARMTGSVIDGEDVLQETLVKAIEAFPHTGPLANVEGWLFRIDHNAALDFLRRRARREGIHDGDEALETIADPDSVIERRQAAAASLRTLMRLPVAQRSSVILMDVFGHSLEEISEVLESTVPAVKANLHRGRQRLVELAAEPDDRPPPGWVGGGPAVVVLDPAQPAGLPVYFMLIDWRDGRLLNVRDFRYARYVVEGGELSFKAF